MKSPLAWGLVLAVGALLLPPPAHADPLPQLDSAHVRQLVKQLDHQSFSVRAEADRLLRAQGIGVVPHLRQELLNRPSLEVYRRLEAIVEDLAQVKWQHELPAALREAQRTGKPVLVLSTLGKSDGTGSLATQAMVGRTLNDLQLIHFINQHYIPVWHQHLNDTQLQDELLPRIHGFEPNYTEEQIRQYEEGRGTRNLRTFFCAPNGKVFRCLEGFASADRYLAQLKDARQLHAEANSVAPEQRAGLLRLILTLRGEEWTRARQGLAGPEAALAELQARLLTASAALVDLPIESTLNDVAAEFRLLQFT